MDIIDVCLIFSTNNVIQRLRNLIGPEDINDARKNYPDSLRAKYGLDSLRNAVHCSLTENLAKKEIKFFFPESN